MKRNVFGTTVANKGACVSNTYCGSTRDEGPYDLSVKYNVPSLNVERRQVREFVRQLRKRFCHWTRNQNGDPVVTIVIKAELVCETE